jgi:hypothetical protein
MPAVLTAADRRLTSHREGGMPDAGGLVIASDQATARSYAAILRTVSGEQPAVVLSDDGAAAGASIAEFARSEQRWMVAVRMVSEGVDVPRLAVGVYATSASTPLFFAQAVGRFVRSRRSGETASVFLPSVPVLLQLASELEEQRDHVLGAPQRPDETWNDEELNEANRRDDEPGEQDQGFTSLGADAELDQLIYEGTTYSADEQDYLGLPGLLEPEQVRTLLSQRQADWVARNSSTRPASRTGAQARATPPPERSGDGTEPTSPPPAQRGPGGVRERLQTLRKELNTLVALHNHKTRKPHGKIHNELRAHCGGPPVAMASIEQLEERIATLRSWR